MPEKHRKVHIDPLPQALTAADIAKPRHNINNISSSFFSFDKSLVNIDVDCLVSMVSQKRTIFVFT